MNISVIGAGYVGLVASCCLAYSGHKVLLVEKDLNKFAQLNQGILPIFEEGLKDIFDRVVKHKKLSFSNEIKESLLHASLIIIAVGTPSKSDGRVDLSQIDEVAMTIANETVQPVTVVMKSTIPPGVGVKIFDRFFSKVKNLISYVSNPEFLREGKAVSDWFHPDRIIVGSACDDAVVKKTMSELYRDIEAPILYMDITSAEMVKYASNAFLATKISFINEIANLCERVQADIDNVAPAVGMDKRIGQDFLKAGIGFGGSCFPKDTKGLDYISSFNGYDFSLLKSVIMVNTKQRILPVRKLQKLFGSLAEKRIAVLGLAFKPFTDDIRESPSLDLIDQLICEGAKVAATDPLAVENARKCFQEGAVEFYSSPYEACLGSQAIIISTEWSEYIDLDWKSIKQTMVSPFILLDGRNALRKEYIKELGFLYVGVGRL